MDINMQKIKIMFDTNAFDMACKESKLVANSLDQIDIFVTGVQVEELSNIPDERKEIRLDNFLTLCDLRPTLVPTIFTFDRIDFNHFSFETEPIYDYLIKENKRNINDALIGATAYHEKCILITDDKDLTKRMKKVQDAQVMTYEEFKNNFINTDGKKLQ